MQFKNDRNMENTYEPLNIVFDTRKGKNQFSKVRFFTRFKDISAHIESVDNKIYYS